MTDFAGIQALTSRSAGYAVAQKCLEVQAAAELREPHLRTDHRVVLHDDAWPWYTGAIGEIEVGRMLTALGPEWFVRHSIPIGAGTKDVDHLVIGPGGVFAINTKHHSGAKVWVGDYIVSVNGGKHHYLKAGRTDGVDVARRLAARVEFPVPVRAVIAVLNPRSLSDSRHVNARPVAVVDARNLVRWIQQQPHQLSDTQLALIKLAAEEPATWHQDPRAADTLRVMPRFERLAAEIGAPIRPQAASRAATPIRAYVPRAPKRQPASSRKPTSNSGLVGVVKIWLLVAFVIAITLILRGFAYQPCSDESVTACMAAPFYLGLKPLLLVLAIGGMAVGAIATIVWAVRRAFR